MAEPDAEPEAPARHLHERRRLLRHRDRMARVDRHDAGPEADALGRVRVRGQHDEAVPAQTVGQPHAVVPERLGAAREIGPGREAVARGEVRAEASCGPYTAA